MSNTTGWHNREGRISARAGVDRRLVKMRLAAAKGYPAGSLARRAIMSGQWDGGSIVGALPAGLPPLEPIVRPTGRDWVLIGRLAEQLMAEEGASVEFTGDNPDFNDLPNAWIGVTAEFTAWEARDYRGDSVEACLRTALADRAAFEIPSAPATADPGANTSPKD